MKVREEYYVLLKGRRYPLYAGVLIAATEAGLRSLTTALIQIPTEENGQMAVVRATAEFEDGRVFSDYGDASPRNTSPQIATAAIRMASTRAKGRALRDAIGLGETLREELPDSEEATNGAGQHPVPVREGVAGPVAGGVRGGQPAGQPARAAGGETQPAPGTAPIPPRCSIQGCGKFLTTKQRQESLDQFGEIYCQAHQPHESVS